MKNGFSLPRALILIAVALWLAGCVSSPSARFYTLNPLPPQGVRQSSPVPANPVSISILPVEIPDYLERPQIVTRDGRNELNLAEYDRWGGSLSENIAAVLAEDLGAILGSDRVYVYPRMQAEIVDYTVVMRVLRLDCTLGDQVLLKAQWTLLAGPDKKDVAMHVTTCTERLNDKRYETMVAAVSRTLEQVSREIAREIPARK
jgi:uncharacterized lipoprotein YmbA